MKNFLDSIAQFLNTKIDFLHLDDLSPALYLLVAGAVLVLIAFFIALIAYAAGKTVKFRKKLDKTTAYVEQEGIIDEANVEALNEQIQTLPTAIGRGWGNFLEQQTGYPSDYITEKEALYSKKSHAKKAGGRVWFDLASAIIILVIAALSCIACLEIVSDPALDAKTLSAALRVILPVVGTLVCPLIVYVILRAILCGVYHGGYRKTKKSFVKFQEALDNYVAIFREEEDQFVAENIEEINAAIEEILANKLENREIIEIVTTPQVVAEEPVTVVEETPPPAIVEPEPEPEPEPEAEPEVVAAAEPQTEEERRGSFLLELVYLADRASRDPNITQEQLVELAEYLYSVMTSGDYDNDEEQEIFTACLQILAGAYYA